MLRRRTVAMILASLGLTWLGIRWGNSSLTPNGLRGDSQTGLSDCPDSPNCVSTSSTRSANSIEPIELGENAVDVQSTLKQIIERMPGSRIVEARDNYIHAEFHSRLLGFVDDVELLVDPAQQKINVRSASRVGYSDFGVNRQRVEEIRQRFDGTR